MATLTGLLAVIAAIIAALPALRILELQEDALRPRPTHYFDLTSRYGLLQLRIKNLGAGVAYDVVLDWKEHPVDHKGNQVYSAWTEYRFFFRRKARRLPDWLDRACQGTFFDLGSKASACARTLQAGGFVRDLSVASTQTRNS